MPRDRCLGAGFAGAASAGLALGLTELFAGFVDRVPSAIASVGSVFVERSPSLVVEMAIGIFGTANKGALAIGTVIVVVLLGSCVGVVTAKYPWVAPVVFLGVAMVAVLTVVDHSEVAVGLTAFLLLLSAFIGLAVLQTLLLLARESRELRGSLSSNPSRRRFVVGAVGTSAAALIVGFGGRSLIIRKSERGSPSIALPPVHAGAPTVAPVAFFDIPGLEQIVIPNDEFYRIDTALTVPLLDSATWSMKVTGLVDNPLELSMDDLLAMDLYEDYVTIACVSNKVGGDLVGNALWTGVRLSDVLRMAGTRSGATQTVGRSIDGWTAGFPTELVFDGREPLIAVGMNNEPLPPAHGFPARLIVPGLYGYVSATKWLTEVELTTWEEFDGYWIPRGWSKNGPIKTQSRIDVPRHNGFVSGRSVILAGVAWAPLEGIERVEVSVDAGVWLEAELTAPLSERAWVQWKAEVEIAPGQHTARVRATDGTGMTQTEIRRPPSPNGATGWDDVTFTAI